MKKTLCLVAAVMGLFACKNQEVPEQTPVEEPQVTTQQNNGAAYFANPVAWNGTFIEIGSAMTKTAPSAQHAPMRTNEDPSYPLYFIDPQDGNSTCPWDRLPSFFAGAPGYFHNEQWLSMPLFTNTNVGEKYRTVCENLDE